MTYKEALKVIDLNKDKLCGSMQEAVKTVCLEVPKAYEKGGAAVRDLYRSLLENRVKAYESAREDNERFGFDTAADDAVLDELRGILEDLEK